MFHCLVCGSNTCVDEAFLSYICFSVFLLWADHSHDPDPSSCHGKTTQKFVHFDCWLLASSDDDDRGVIHTFLHNLHILCRYGVLCGGSLMVTFSNVEGHSYWRWLRCDSKVKPDQEQEKWKITILLFTILGPFWRSWQQNTQALWTN